MKNFVHYSKKLGKQPRLVQGAGGNTSVKKDGLIWIKASGYFLKDVDVKKGYAVLHNRPVTSYLLSLQKYSPKMEAEFSGLVAKNLLAQKSFGRPSIETGMHCAISSRYVFHTHSVLANIFNFARGGEKIIQQLFPEALIMPYKNPGLELAYALMRQKKPGKNLPKIIFLKNHGLITHSDDPHEAYNLTATVEKNIIQYLKRYGAYLPFKIAKNPAPLKQHMFPDSVVYSQINFKNLSADKKKVFEEICSLINYVLAVQKKLGLKPVFLTGRQTKFIVNMEQEKFRIKMLHNYA